MAKKEKRVVTVGYDDLAVVLNFVEQIDDDYRSYCKSAGTTPRSMDAVLKRLTESGQRVTAMPSLPFTPKAKNATHITADEGFNFSEIAAFVKANKLDNAFVTLCVQDIETFTSRVVKVVADPNTDGEAGGVLWLHVQPTTEEKLTEAFEKE